MLYLLNLHYSSLLLSGDMLLRWEAPSLVFCRTVVLVEDVVYLGVALFLSVYQRNRVEKSMRSDSVKLS